MNTQQIKAVRELWIPALLNGTYEQGQRVLRTWNNNYCCLGVACDVSGLGEWTDDKQPVYSVAGRFSSVHAPYPVAELFGLDSAFSTLALPPNVESPYVHFGKGDQRIFLTSMNDNNNYSFEKIAEVLEFACSEWEKYNGSHS